MKKVEQASSKTVLIIDDEEEIGLLLKRILRKKFKIVEHALTLKEGLAYSLRLKPNVILLDNNLPDGSGIERLSEFKSIYPGACIIIVSAMTHLKRQALENGAFAFVEKPWSYAKIMETIESA